MLTIFFLVQNTLFNALFCLKSLQIRGLNLFFNFLVPQIEILYPPHPQICFLLTPELDQTPLEGGGDTPGLVKDQTLAFFYEPFPK